MLTHKGATQDTAGPSLEGVSPPLSPFAVVGVQAAAERTAAVDDGRFSSLQRLSGSASTSQQVCALVVGFGGSRCGVEGIRMWSSVSQGLCREYVDSDASIHATTTSTVYSGWSSKEPACQHVITGIKKLGFV